MRCPSFPDALAQGRPLITSLAHDVLSARQSKTTVPSGA